MSNPADASLLSGSPRPSGASCAAGSPRPSDAPRPRTLPWMKYTAEALSHWGLGNAATRPLSLSENATYLVETPSGNARTPGRYVLRLHRPGYREESWIRSELAWIDDLASKGDIKVASPIPTRSGDTLCTFTNPEGSSQCAVLFEYLEGKEPAETGLATAMERIGRIAAIMHESALSWRRPEWFERIVWDENRIVGTASDFGDWRDTPEVTPELRKLFERAEAKMLKEMAEYGKTPENFGLIHTDLRSSNLLIDEKGTVKVIDFDDCGEGWFLFDIACTFSFEESADNIEDMVLAYLKGYYAANGTVPVCDLSYLPTMLIARRLMLIAWVEKRKETIWASLIRNRYIAETQQIALDYLQDRYLPRILEMAHSAKTLSNVA